jgi:hypothetical protein
MEAESLAEWAARWQRLGLLLHRRGTEGRGRRHWRG